MSIPEICTYAMPCADQLPANKVNWAVQPERAVLLIHDMQDYFLRYFGEASPVIEQLKQNIVAIRSWATHNQVPVVYTAQPSVQSLEDRALLNDMWGPGLTNADPALQKITQALAPDEQDTLLVKWRYSAFQRSPLQSLMQQWQRDQLIIVGVYAHIGCLATALDAFMQDIQAFMVADAVADFSAAEHDMALRYIAGRCGCVLPTAQVLQAAPNAQIDRAWLQAQLLEHLDEAEEPIDAEENLMDYGLDSIRVMTLIAQWEKLGIKVRFDELAREPSLNAWWNLIEQKRAA